MIALSSCLSFCFNSRIESILCCLQLDESMFVGIEVGQSLVVEDPDGDFVVTAFDANHCPGVNYCLIGLKKALRTVLCCASLVTVNF